MTYWPTDPIARFWSVPDGRLLSSVDKGVETLRTTAALYTALNMVRVVRADDGDWTLDRRGADRLQQIDPGFALPADLSHDGEVLAYGVGAALYAERVGRFPAEGPRLIGTPNRPIQLIAFDPDGSRIATQDSDGNVELWFAESAAGEPSQPRRGFEPADQLLFNRSGSMLVAVSAPHVFVSDLLGPPDAEAVALEMPGPTDAAFDVGGKWLAVAGSLGAQLWPVDRRHLTAVLRGHASTPAYSAFAPDGRWLASASGDRTVRWWPLEPSAGQSSKVVFEALESGPVCPRVSVNATHIAVAWGGDAVRIVPIDGGTPVDLKGLGEPLHLIAIDPQGRYVAAAEKDGPLIRVWDLGSGELSSLDVGDGLGVECFRAVANGRLLVRHTQEPGSSPGLSLWDVETERHERLFDGEPVVWRFDADAELEVSEDGRFVLGARVEPGDSGDRSLFLTDLAGRSLRRLDGFTALLWGLDSVGSTVVNWDIAARKGPFLQVGRVSSESPHFVPYPFDANPFGFPSLSPKADRIAQGYGDGRIWLYRRAGPRQAAPPHPAPRGADCQAQDPHQPPRRSRRGVIHRLEGRGRTVSRLGDGAELVMRSFPFSRR